MPGDTYEPRKRTEVEDGNGDTPKREINATAVAIVLIICLTIIALAIIAAGIYLAIR